MFLYVMDRCTEKRPVPADGADEALWVVSTAQG